jgi:hypothetical protein
LRNQRWALCQRLFTLASEQWKNNTKRFSNGHDYLFFCCLYSFTLKTSFMAKQKGVFKIEGTLDDVTFYKSKDGYLVREKGGVSADRIASDPAFARTRENQAEFGRAGKAGKLLRIAIRPLLQSASDSRMVSRLHKAMMQVVKADSTSSRGQRNVLDGELQLLEGFEFNANGKLGQTFFVLFTTSIDRAAGTLRIALPSFAPLQMISAPAEATHYQLVAGGGGVGFEDNTHTLQLYSSGILALTPTPGAASNIDFTVPAGTTHPLFLFMGISFFQEVNGSHYSLKNGAYNALAVVKVSGM